MSKVFVTGGSGHVGGNLIRELLKQKRKVKVLFYKDDEAFKDLDVERIQGDILDKNSLLKALEDVDIVYHLAAIISITGPQGGRVNHINVQGTKNIVEACLETKVKRLIHFSSIHAMSKWPLTKTINENSELATGPKELAYDRSKAQGIEVVKKGIKKGLDAVIVHPTGIIGPNDFKPSRMGNVLKMIYNGSLAALVNGGFNWVDVRDVVNGAIAAEKHGKKGERYILSGHWKNMKELFKIISKVAGKKDSAFVCPTWLAVIGASFYETYAKITKTQALYTRESLNALKGHKFIDNSKTKKLLNYNARPIDETINDTLNWFIERKDLTPTQ